MYFELLYENIYYYRYRYRVQYTTGIGTGSKENNMHFTGNNSEAEYTVVSISYIYTVIKDN